MADEKKLTDMLSQLEEIVDQLEHDDVSLETSFSLYKNGIETAKLCYEKLRGLEKEVVMVQKGIKGFTQEPISHPAVTKKEDEGTESSEEVSADEECTDIKKGTENVSTPGLFED